MARKFSLKFRLPENNCVVVLNGSVSNPINKSLQGFALFNYSLRDRSIWIRSRFLIRLIRLSWRYGFGQGHLIALLASIKAHAIVCMEQSDRQNILRSVSFELPQLRIICCQQSRNYEAPHPFSSWGNAKNVRMLVWGDELGRDVEKLGFSSSLHIPVGSLSLSQFVDAVGTPEPAKAIDILVCVKPKYLMTSASATDRKTAAGWHRGGLSKHNLLSQLGQYARSRGLSLSFPIDPRSGSEDPRAFLKQVEQVSGAPCQLVSPADLPQSSSRPHSDSTLWTILYSKVVVGLNTSLLWDAVALRVPVVYAFFGESRYNWFPELGDWVMHDPKYEQLAAVIDASWQTSRTELERRSALLHPYLRDPMSMSASKFLRSLIIRSFEAETLDDTLSLTDDGIGLIVRG